MQIKSQHSTISLLALVLLITGAIDSIRNLPATALFGSTLIFFFVVSAIIFLIPVAFIAAELASTWSDEEGGIYSWVKHAFGSKAAFFTIWLQWINTMVWYPTMLSFIAGTATYFIDPTLASSKPFLITSILIVFWGLTLLGTKGIHASARFASICAVIGVIIPMAMIIGMAVVWVVGNHPLHVHFTLHNMFPQLHRSEGWISLTAIMASFLGMELAAVHVKQVRDPKRNFPKAIFFSVILILVTMIMGSLAIAFVLPSKDILLVEGVMQAFTNFFSVYHLEWMIPVITAMLLIGSLGGMINWIISPAKGLLVAAEHGYLPRFLTKRNQHGVASNLLVVQAILVTLLCGGFLLIPSINGIYWLLTALSTQIYILMYIMMFFAAIKIKKAFPDLERPFSVPGGKVGYHSWCVLGLIGCLVTLAVGFIPPAETLEVGGALHYEIVFCSGFVGMLLPCLLFYYYRAKRLEHV